MMVGQYRIKKPGRPPKYDRSKIEDLIKSGKDNQSVANEIGCDVSRVKQIRRALREEGAF